MSALINSKNECYTPAYFVDPIRDFANGFDFDPFSSDEANKTVKAASFCTIENSAYLIANNHLWLNSRKLWVNPPYSASELRRAVGYVIGLGLRGDGEVYLLLNTDNSTRAYKRSLSHCTAIMLVSERIKFVRPYADKAKGQNNRSQTLFFFGRKERALRLKQELSHLGKVFIND